MLTKIKKFNSEGFTIIEVMIVLAVAALILLIVLLAVPALQRNSRNTALKNDVSTVAGGISSFESNFNGNVPNSVATGATGGTVTIKDANGDKDTVNVQGATIVTSFVNATPGTNEIPTTTTGAAASVNNVPTGQIVVIAEDACTGTQASTRSFAIFYDEETSSSASIQCVGA